MLYRPGKSRRGIAATEMAIMAPVVLTLLMGLWEVGRYIAMQNLLDNAAREGGRLGCSGSYFSSNNMYDSIVPHPLIVLPAPSKNTACELQQKVLLYLQSAGVSTTGATVTVTNTGTAGSSKNWTYTYTAGGTISGSGYDPTGDANQLDQLGITVTLPYTNIAWSPLSWFVSQSATMTAKASWNSIVDIPLAVSTTIPTKPLLPSDPLP